MYAEDIDEKSMDLEGNDSNKVPRELSSDDEMATDVEIVFPIELMNMNSLED
jgi:hypothetical protein